MLLALQVAIHVMCLQPAPGIILLISRKSVVLMVVLALYPMLVLAALSDSTPFSSLGLTY